MAAWKTCGEDPHRVNRKIRTRARKRRLEQIAQRDDAAKTRYVASRLLQPCGADGNGRIARVAQGEDDSPIERQGFSSGDLLGDKAEGEEKKRCGQNRYQRTCSADSRGLILHPAATTLDARSRRHVAHLRALSQA